jgi:acyl-CoA reductase-like NAD-dependent aldehyde dehydrogenase
VLIKPGLGSTGPARALQEVFVDAGLDRRLVPLLPESTESVQTAIQSGVDKVVLTGSAEAGRNIQSLLADSLTPSTMELSGCDAVFVLESADLERVARCLAFGLRFNGSATCIAPRRIFVPATVLSELETRLRDEFAAEEHQSESTQKNAALVQDAVRQGARLLVGDATLASVTVLSDARASMQLLQTDVFAPITSLVPVNSMEEALQANDECPYALGAAVFGAEDQARQLAVRVNAGCVVINDVIAPTADPRVPFGGRRQSGFGVTRGAAGLEEMTCLKAIVQQRSRWLPHLEPTTPFDAPLLAALVRMTHGRRWSERLRSAIEAVQTIINQRKWTSRRHSGRGEKR